MPKFKVGDKVKCIRGYENEEIVNMVGKIIGKSRYGLYAVEFIEEFSDGHDCDGMGRDGFCWYILASCLKILEKKKIKPFGIVTFCKRYYK